MRSFMRKRVSYNEALSCGSLCDVFVGKVSSPTHLVVPSCSTPPHKVHNVHGDEGTLACLSAGQQGPGITLPWALVSMGAWSLPVCNGRSMSSAAPRQQPEPHHHVHSVDDIENECWSCQHHVKRGTFSCLGCEKIQPVDSSLNFFELMGMPNMSFDVDVTKLERQYKLLQWHLHPDKVMGKTSEEREFAAQQATLINQAYSVLRAPLSRANYILTLKGINMGEDSALTITDPELLMQVLETREEVEETDDPGRLRQLLEDNLQAQARVVRSLSASFREQAWEHAAKHATELAYLVRLQQEISHKLPL